MRRSFVYITISLLALLSACGGPKQIAKDEPSLPPPALDQMNERFLYLAAQDAIRQGQRELAVRFLSALTEKEPEERLPHLQLADLLLGLNRYEQALKHVEKAIEGLDINEVASDEDSKPFLLYAQALAATDNHDKSLDTLEKMLNRRPELLDVRLLQVRILANLKRNFEAYQSIRDGIRVADSASLRNIQADLLIREGNLDKAEAELLRLLELAPDEESAAITLSRIALQQNNSAKAESILRDFIASHPRAMVSRNSLGRILVQQGRLDEAIEIYRGLVRDTGNDVEVSSALGLIYYQNQQYAEAAEQFRNILKLAPNDDANRFYLASSLEALDQRKEAETLYRQIDPESRVYVDAQLRLAGIELGNEQFDAAMKRIKAVLKKHPDSANAYMLLSGIYLIEKDYRKLLDETEPALRLPVILPRLLFNRAIAYEFFKRFEDVEAMLKQLLKIEPDNAEALNFLGYVYADQGIKLDEAEKLIMRALEQKPEDGYYLDSLAWIHFKRGQFDKAVAVQKRAIEQISDDPVIREHMGDMLWKQGKHQEARSQWQESLDLKHDSPEVIQRKLEEGLN